VKRPVALLLILSGSPCYGQAPEFRSFFDQHCYECHDSETHKGQLDLTGLDWAPSDPENARRWIKVFDRVHEGEMPPKKKPRPPAPQKTAFTTALKNQLIAAEKADDHRRPMRRLTRTEYENTLRDLFDMPRIALKKHLPADGSAHGFDKNSEALDLSHVNLAKYFEAAEHTLDLAIATRPEAPVVHTRRISLANRGGFVAHIIMNGDGVLLRDKKPDPAFPPASEHRHIDQGAHEQMGSFRTGSTVGLFRHEDESVSPYFIEHVTVYPGRYRVRTSLWSFHWDKGTVLPSRGTEAARLSVVQLTGDGRGGQHPSVVLGYYDAPSMDAQEHEVITWLNHNELIGFNTASLAPTANYNRKGRAMAFTGPGIAVDWLDIEGPLHESWPPASHRVLFDDLPMVEFTDKEARAPIRTKVRQLGAGQNRRDPEHGVWTMHSTAPLNDADRLLADFLPRAFRRPVNDELRKQYVAQVDRRLKAGDSFETAMRWAYRAALCAPDFLFHVEPPDTLDAYALANRLAYFLWNSQPDETLIKLAVAGQLDDPETLRAQVERLLKDPRSERFIEDFLGQWLKLRSIAATDPDRKLYPEFSPYLQDSMVMETQAFFRELIEQDLDATHLVRPGFAMLNEKLAVHYGIPNVKGSQMRRVALPKGSPRGGFLTQAAILKITANGTTTSPVIRGAFVMDRIFGRPLDPPPPDIPAVEPDVRGTVTIREQLEKHRADPSCAGCHAKMDPPGFALESFDVIGGQRSRYRSIGEGDPAERGAIDPFIGISFKLGPAVDASGEILNGRTFTDIDTFLDHAAAEEEQLLINLARQLTIYASGRPVRFSDRDTLDALIDRTRKQSGGIRCLIHELIQSPLFLQR
jgi:hypothetical protein